MRIYPLSSETLRETSVLAEREFKIKKSDNEYPPKWLQASLGIAPYKKFLHHYKVSSLQYFAAIEGDRVVGVIGYYSYKRDPSSYWLGWFCVHPHWRGRKIGSRLLDFIIKKARKNNKKFLRLYTSDRPKEAIAQKLYEQKGFLITRRIKEKHSKNYIVYRKLLL